MTRALGTLGQEIAAEIRAHATLRRSHCVAEIVYPAASITWSSQAITSAVTASRTVSFTSSWRAPERGLPA